MKINDRAKLVYWFVILLAALFALAGCAPVPGAPSTDQTPAAGEGTATVPVGATPGVPETGENRVEVQLEEYTINMPATINAGQTSFEVTNVGTEEHSFRIEGQGIEAELERHLQPGETLTLDVNLTPGSYLVFCPVNDHAEEGMQLNLTVSSP